MFDLTGKTAVVTGGGSGIGEAISKVLSKQGATVAVLDLSQENAKKVAEEIKREGGSAFEVVCDISSMQSVKSAFETIAKRSSVEILINNAGIAHVGNIDTTGAEDFERVLSVNVRGVYHCTKVAIGQMKVKGGAIINISSVAAHVGVAERFAYSMSKGAVHAMTLSVAKDYLAYNIRCNSISPGRVHTPFVDGFLAENYPGKEKYMFEKLSKSQPMGRMGKPTEIGALVLYLCSDEASFVTGTDFPIDGGFLTLNT